MFLVVRKLKCILGSHKWEFVMWSEYKYSLDPFNIQFKKQAIYKCKSCGKYLNVPKWYKKKYRKMYPFVDFSGFGKDWKPEIKEIAEL